MVIVSNHHHYHHVLLLAYYTFPTQYIEMWSMTFDDKRHSHQYIDINIWSIYMIIQILIWSPSHWWHAWLLAATQCCDRSFFIGTGSNRQGTIPYRTMLHHTIPFCTILHHNFFYQHLFWNLYICWTSTWVYLVNFCIGEHQQLVNTLLSQSKIQNWFWIQINHTFRTNQTTIWHLPCIAHPRPLSLSI